jgi:hypothetical protein
MSCHRIQRPIQASNGLQRHVGSEIHAGQSRALGDPFAHVLGKSRDFLSGIIEKAQGEEFFRPYIVEADGIRQVDLPSVRAMTGSFKSFRLPIDGITGKH